MHAWEQIQLTVDYIEAHLGEELSPLELAKLAALSPYYYQRLFSRLVKKPVAEYIKLRRMARSLELIRDTDRRILDIALELGFSSHEQFTRSFKETFGLTPEDYRAKPITLSRMTKPELLLQYTIIDEDVPLVTDGVVLEVMRRTLAEPVRFAGYVMKMPLSFMDGLGTDSGYDPLGELWDRVHAKKLSDPALDPDADELGITYASTEEGYFNYYAGCRCKEVPEGCECWTLDAGDYVVCSFDAENFEALVMDALFKATKYVFDIWLPAHKLPTKPFCAERYSTHTPETTSMELWIAIDE